MSETNEYLSQIVSQNMLMIDLLTQIQNKMDFIDAKLTRLDISTALDATKPNSMARQLITQLEHISSKLGG